MDGGELVLGELQRGAHRRALAAVLLVAHELESAVRRPGSRFLGVAEDAQHLGGAVGRAVVHHDHLHVREQGEFLEQPQPGEQLATR